ncbi:MAG: helix-turn-helix transcriptional regulator [Rhabdochlamydiaceae bacterium]
MKTKPQPTNENRDIAFDPDNNHVLDAILEIFKNHKIHPIMKVIGTHLQSTNKSAFSKKIGISRATLYDMLNGKKNPTLRIFVNCVHQVLLDLAEQKTTHSTKPKKSKDSLPSEKIVKDKQLILDAVVEIFKRNQIHPMIDVIHTYLKSKNKTVFAKHVGISRATVYDMLSGKKNPTLLVFMQCVSVMLNATQET